MTKPATPERLADLRRRYLLARGHGERRTLRRAILRVVEQMKKPGA